MENRATGIKQISVPSLTLDLGELTYDPETCKKITDTAIRAQNRINKIWEARPEWVRKDAISNPPKE